MKYYLIGIKGSGMSSLACLLYDLGYSVIGYDDSEGYKFTMEGLLKRGIEIHHNEDYPKLDKDTIVTYTAAIDLSHHEVKRVKDLGYKIIPYKDVMAGITKQMESNCVCGTHGKTTTSLILSKILDKAFKCSYFVGDGTGHGEKDNNLFVIESCEYNKHFLSYYPFNTIVTNIDLDHTETYHNIDMMVDTFNEFINKTKNYVILCGDDDNTRKLKVKKAYYYGFNDKNDLIIKNRRVENNKTLFDIYYQGTLYDSYQVNMFGDHLILDCAAAIMMSILYKVDKKNIKDVIENFIPAKRRFNETILESNVIVDDYAHHPTEIRATYDSAHQKYPNKKIIAVFLPNTYSRTEDLFDDFVKSLSLYDKAYLMKISSDRERQEDYPNINSGMLVDKIPNSEMISLDTIDKLSNLSNTVICFMSCAYISPMVLKAKEILSK